MSNPIASTPNDSGTLGETRVQDVLLRIEQLACDARVWFETEYGMGEVLFHSGKMVKARLGGARGLTALLRLLALSEGKFGVDSCSVGQEPPIVPNTSSLIELHSARKAEWTALCSNAPPLRSVLRLTAGGADVRDSLRGIQRVIFALIDSHRTILQILEESSFDPVEALKIVTKALDDDLAQISLPATSLFPLAPAGNDSGVLPRFAVSPSVPRLDPAAATAELEPPSWRHATLVGLGSKLSASNEPSSRLSPAPIIDVGRCDPRQYGTDSTHGVAVNSLVKTVIHSLQAGQKASSSTAAVEVTESSEGLNSNPRYLVRSTGILAGSATSKEAPRHRVLDIDPDSSIQPEHDSRGHAISISGQSPTNTSGPRADGQRRYVDRYEILLRIGRGTIGTVYLARLSSENVGFRRLLAVKLLRSQLSLDTEASEEFLNQARVAGCLHHANIVSVYDAGVHGKQPYLVMEYVEGCSLKQLTRGLANRPPYFLLPIIIDALAGLHAAHTLQDESGTDLHLVHCDVSPENMLVGVDGTCRLTDFGMARNTSRLLGNATRGKTPYLAPERITGKAFDHRSDIYSLGVVLWGALTGKPLFTGETTEDTIEQVCSKQIVPPSAMGAQSSPALDEIVMRALSRNPNERFDSAEEMLSKLSHVAADYGGLATPKEIASWVREAAGTELTQQRLAILDASRNNPTIPPPPVELGQSSNTSSKATGPVAHADWSFDPQLGSTGTASELRHMANGEDSFQRLTEASTASMMNSGQLPPPSDIGVTSFFYGADEFESRLAPSQGRTSVRESTKSRRHPVSIARRLEKPWMLVALLVFFVALVLFILIQKRPQRSAVGSLTLTTARNPTGRSH